MIKTEISEIKTLYNIKNCSIKKMAGCYVNGEKEIVSTFSKSFLSLPEEEMFKYLEIFKKALSGKKNISTVEFPTKAEEPGSMHEFLLRLKDTELKNEDMLDLFYQKVIEKFDSESQNFLILLIHNTYDIPGRGDDNFKNIEASDEVYDYISFYLCPVKLEDGGLCYNKKTGSFERKDRRWCIEMPSYSFLFPSFEDRSTDIHHITIYTKKTNGEFDMFTTELLGITPAIAPDVQKYSFQSALSEAVQNDPNAMDTIKSINELIVDRISEKETPDDITFDTAEIKKIAEESGLSEEGCAVLEDNLIKAGGGRTFNAENLVDKKNIQLKSPDVIIKVSNDLASQVKTKVIDNAKYILVPIASESDVEINGISLG